jgi:hypothetical protein
MSTVHTWQTIIEIAVAAVLIYGLFHEDKLVAFEERVIKKFRGNK